MASDVIERLQQLAEPLLKKKTLSKRIAQNQGLALLRDIISAGRLVGKPKERMELTQIARELSEKILEATGEYYSPKLEDSVASSGENTVTANSKEPAEAMQRLSCLPTDVIPEPQAMLPPCSWMGQLRRNPLFVGRESDLRALATLLKGKEAATVNQAPSVVISGIGGIGKSQLAIEFAYRYGKYFAGGVFWLACANPTQLQSEVAACGGVGLVEVRDWSELKLPDQVRLVREAWAAPTPRLLIFDNCEDAALLAAWRPSSGGCRILVTSRQDVWPASMGVIALPLRVLPRIESLALLGKHRSDLAQHPALDALAAEVGDLPLALHLAGSYLETYRDDPTFGDPTMFLAELRGPNLLAHEVMQGLEVSYSPTGHELSVAKSFAMSLNQLEPADATDVAARALLARAAHFAPGEPIPRQVLLTSLAPDAEDRPAQKQAVRALQRLRGLGLIDASDSDAPRLHRLLAAYARQACPDPAALEDVERELLAELTARRDAGGYIASINDLLPHLRHVIETALPRADERAALLANELADYLHQIADYAAARLLLERALAIRKAVFGPMHPDTANSFNSLGKLLYAQGYYAAARPLYERALAIWETNLGPQNPVTVQGLNNLAVLLYAMGDYAAARPLYERALAISEAVLGPLHPYTQGTRRNLAALDAAEGRE